MDITYFDRTTASDETLNKFFDFADKLMEEIAPNDPIPPRETQINSFRVKNPDVVEHRFLAWENNEVIAYSSLSWTAPSGEGYEENKHIAQLNIIVDKNLRFQGIGKTMLVHTLQKLDENPNIKKIFAGTWWQPAIPILEKYGGIFSSEGAENKLDLEQVDWDMIKQWKKKGDELAEKEGITLRLFEECPEDILEEYTKIYQETMNQQPLGEYDGVITVTPTSRRKEEERVKKQGRNWFTMITVEKDGTISGLTEIFYHKDNPIRADQNLTGVREAYRGRGLGKYLKASMLLWLVEKYPEIKAIYTGNDETNAPMLSINRRMGFKKNIAFTQFVFERDELLSQVEKLRSDLDQ